MISVVTPSLNQSEWLRLAVASVADQSDVSVEHIVQDALSSDGTRGWLEKINACVRFLKRTRACMTRSTAVWRRHKARSALI